LQYEQFFTSRSHFALIFEMFRYVTQQRYVTLAPSKRLATKGKAMRNLRRNLGSIGGRGFEGL
jgi:hypothetical protein